MDKNFQEDSDYHTGSEYEQDFDSDNEPPVDKLIEKKMIHKGKDLRVYKRILKFGKRGFERPAAFDKININFGYVEKEIELIKDLNTDDLQYKELQIGLGELGSEEFFKIAVSTMKHQEVAFFEIEKLKFTEHKDRKLDERIYFVVEVFDWMTIIDFEGDQKIFKILYNKGSGIHRVEKTDILKMKVSLNDHNFQCFYEQEWNYKSFKEIEADFQNFLDQINFSGKKDIFEYSVTNMKNQDLIILEIDKEQFPNVQKQDVQRQMEFFDKNKQAIFKNDVFYNTNDQYYYLVIDLQALTYFEDVFMDQSVIKEVKKNGYTTAKPEDLSKVYFDFNIIVNDQEIYTTFKERPEPTEDHEQKFFDKNNYFWEYLNEYKYSKALEGTLKLMKKFEECQIVIKNLSKLQRGEDLQIISDYLKQNNIQLTQENIDNKKIDLKYNLKLFYFKEGQNSFTIDLEQRKQFIERRKVKAVDFLQNKQYKKALKLFHKIDNLAEYGVFDEDKQLMIPYRKSALLNISLIYWKMENWSKMKDFSEKVLTLEPNNVKAIYRSALSSFKQYDHEQALQKLQSYEHFQNDKDLKSLYDKIRKDFQTFKKKTKQIFSKFKVDKQIQQHIYIQYYSIQLFLFQNLQNLIKQFIMISEIDANKNSLRKSQIIQTNSKVENKVSKSKTIVTNLDSLQQFTISFWVLTDESENLKTKTQVQKKVPLMYVCQGKKRPIQLYLWNKKIKVLLKFSKKIQKQRQRRILSQFKFKFFLKKFDNNQKNQQRFVNLYILFSFQLANEYIVSSDLIVVLQIKPNSNFLLFDVFCSSKTNIDFANYYQKSLQIFQNKKFKESFIPFQNYENHEEQKRQLTELQGTHRNYFDQTLDYRIEKRAKPKIQGGFVFEKYYEQIYEELRNFDCKNNYLYPQSCPYPVQKKQIFVEIQSLLKNYIFIHRNLTLLSPPIKETDSNEWLKFIKTWQNYCNEDHQFKFPLYIIEFKRFQKFLNNFYHFSKQAAQTLFNIVNKSPYMLSLKDQQNKIYSLVYDKSMLLFCDLFLDKSTIQDIKNQLIQCKNYQILHLDPDNDQRRQLCNKIVQLLNPEQRQLSYYDCFLKKSVNFTMIDLRDILSQQDLVFQKPQKITFKNQENGSCQISLLYKENQIHYCIPLQLVDEKNLSVCMITEKIIEIKYQQNEYFQIVKMTIYLQNNKEIQFMEKGLCPNTILQEKSFKLLYEMINFHVLFQDESFVGFFIIYNCKNILVDEQQMKQQHIMPYEYDIEQFYGCQLRFDISLFSKEQFNKYNNSISLIKYDLESYQQNSNLVMQFLESVFPNCSGYVNHIPPQSIGDFSVYLMGVAHGCSDINKQTQIQDNNFYLFKNKRINHFPTKEELYDQFCYLLAKSGQLKLLQDKQNQFLIKKGIDMQPGLFEQIEEEKIDINQYIQTRKQQNTNNQVVCANYGCGQTYYENENNTCNGHDGTWDFGHTGVSITETLQEYKKKKSKKILWKPHWSCCGQSWQQQCSKIHQHYGVNPEQAKNVELNFENPDLQKMFKKKVRESWNQQVDKFHKFSANQIKKKILYYAQKCHIKDPKQIPIDQLPELCDQCHMHILVTSDDMSYHFKFLDLVNGKAFDYLKTEQDFIDIDKFQQWWFCSLKNLENFKQFYQ